MLRQRVLAISIASLALYPAAVGLPVMTLARFGHRRSTSVLGGIEALWDDGHPLLAAVVLACSVVVPLVKLAALVALAIGEAPVGCPRRSRLVRWLEVSGRWGMLDVLLVAGLVAAVKLGELVRIDPGPGAIAFVGCVSLAIIAGAIASRLERCRAAPALERATNELAHGVAA